MRTSADGWADWGCCPWLFGASSRSPALRFAPDASPKDAEVHEVAATPESLPEFFMDIADDHPDQEAASRDLVHANFCAFQEENLLFAPPAPLPLPVLVVTGFLGSGKTTLLKQLMQRRGNLRVACVAHDLAGANVDGAFLASERGLGKGEYLFQQAMAACRDGDIAALSGCACCPGFDDALAAAVRSALTQGADTGLLDYLVLETSGAADPRRMVAALEVRFGPLARVRLDRVATLVDAERFIADASAWEDASQATGEELLQLAQLSVADLVLLNKVDLISEEALGRAEDLLRRLCPHAKVISCCRGDVPVPELLDVEAAVSVAAAVSHEDTPACWQVSSSSLEPARHHESGLSPGLGDGKVHHRVVEWSSRDNGSLVQLSKLQSLLSEQLPRMRRWLRRGKGVLRLAEDPSARWEWELSGQLRFNLRRFEGGAPSSLVLIFSDSVPDAVQREAEAALHALADCDGSLGELEAEASELAKLGFEVLEDPKNAQPCLRFRLTGIDLDAMNAELALLVSSEKGPNFLGAGAAICPATKRRVLALLWPLGMKADGDRPSAFSAVLAALRREAEGLLTRRFGHVTTCMCGQEGYVTYEFVERVSRPILRWNKERIRVLGVDIERNEGRWHFAMTFPVRVKGENDKKFDDAVWNPAHLWKSIFPSEMEVDAGLEDGMSWESFTAMVRENVKNYLVELGCEVDQFYSVDMDEIFMVFCLPTGTAMTELAMKVDARVRICPTAYEKTKKFQCPTDIKQGQEFVVRDVGINLKGETVNNQCPAFVRYTHHTQGKAEELTETEILRVCKRGFRTCFSDQHLLQVGVCRLFFAVHKWDQLMELYKRGWNDPTRLIYWPHEGITDEVAEYFGAHAATFFHFYNSFTRWMLFPALVSVIITAARPFVPTGVAHWVDSGFGVGMCIWTTLYLSRYRHLMNVKLLRWGMGGSIDNSIPVRRQFQDELRGTWSEGGRALFHWFLCALFIAETFWMVSFVASLRLKALHAPEGTMFFSIDNETMSSCLKYVVTANIKIVDAVWSPLSIWLSKCENHRTEVDMKSSMVLKLFAVKFVIFYYPFARTIILQPMVEGCPGGEMLGCLRDLRSDLQVFFVTQVISVAAGLLLQLFFMWKTVHNELKRKKDQNKLLTYLEVQGMLAEYDEAAEVEDFMQVALNFGFLSMFGTVCPMMCVLCFLLNFPLKRLLAYRFSFAQQRTIPTMCTGVGSWASILSFLAYIGVTCTCYIVIFCLHNFASEGIKWKLIYFIVGERLLQVLKLILDASVGEKCVAQQRIEECNDDAVDLILHPHLAQRNRHQLASGGTTPMKDHATHTF
ncbi:unnamed protein product [Effrenium voratum]|uniref:Uncharacterized protein n=1 Tax=Effrenium voratum TaxID=2562239 RepID=A0AA36I432_9DINO|nr:unnamed protein product [Effrenium voratum]